ncbi:unnamed protein product, partial [Chrysoparadoxa australica]
MILPCRTVMWLGLATVGLAFHGSIIVAPLRASAAERCSCLSMAGGAPQSGGGYQRKKRMSKKQRRTIDSSTTGEREQSIVKKDKVSRLNWDRLRSSSAQNDDDGKSLTTRGWKGNTEKGPKAGDLLKCKHFGECAGCTMDRAFTLSPAMMEATAFCEALMIQSAKQARGAAALDEPTEFKIHMGDVHSWRTQAKLAVAPKTKWGGVRLGLYRAGSHDVMPIPDCRVHHPAINEAARVLTAACMKCKITGYRPAADDGMLRYVQASVERRSGKVQLTLVWNVDEYKESVPHLQLLVKELKKQAPDLFHSIWANFRTGGGNAILSREPKRWHKCSGPEFIKEEVQGVVHSLSPQLFRQGNLDQFDHVVAEAVRWTPEGAKVCELYAGVGVIGLAMAHNCEWVRCSDVNDANPRAFNRGQSSLPEEMQKKVSYQALSAEEAIEEGEADDADVMVVDPPRKGLDQGVLSYLTGRGGSSVRRVIYVSCGFDAFKRDAAALTDRGESADALPSSPCSHTSLCCSLASLCCSPASLCCSLASLWQQATSAWCMQRATCCSQARTTLRRWPYLTDDAMSKQMEALCHSYGALETKTAPQPSSSCGTSRKQAAVASCRGQHGLARHCELRLLGGQMLVPFSRLREACLQRGRAPGAFTLGYLVAGPG